MPPTKKRTMPEMIVDVSLALETAEAKAAAAAASLRKARNLVRQLDKKMKEPAA